MDFNFYFSSFSSFLELIATYYLLVGASERFSLYFGIYSFLFTKLSINFNYLCNPDLRNSYIKKSDYSNYDKNAELIRVLDKIKHINTTRFTSIEDNTQKNHIYYYLRPLFIYFGVLSSLMLILIGFNFEHSLNALYNCYFITYILLLLYFLHYLWYFFQFKDVNNSKRIINRPTSFLISFVIFFSLFFLFHKLNLHPKIISQNENCLQIQLVVLMFVPLLFIFIDFALVFIRISCLKIELEKFDLTIGEDNPIQEIEQF